MLEIPNDFPSVDLVDPGLSRHIPMKPDISNGENS